jgi:hypothetical protein
MKRQKPRGKAARSKITKAERVASRKNGGLGGRPLGEVGKLAKELGISRQAAWYRLNRSKA